MAVSKVKNSGPFCSRSPRLCIRLAASRKPAAPGTCNESVPGWHDFETVKPSARSSIVPSILFSLATVIASAHASGLIFERDPSPRASGYKIVPFATEGAHTGAKSYFTDKNGNVLKVDNISIMGIVRFPDIQNLTDQSSLASLRAKNAELEAVAEKVPNAKPYLGPQIAAIQSQIARFQSGERKVNGKWLTGSEYQKFQADAAAAKAAAEAQEQKRLAEQKAAEDKRRAEEEALEEKRRAEQKALEDKRIEEKKAAERERAEKEQKATADLKRSNEQFEAMEQRAAESYRSSAKGTLSGQVFVSTKGGESVKLGAVQISLFARDAMDTLVAGLKAYADARIEQLREPLGAAQATMEQAKSAEEQAEAAEQVAWDAYLKSIGDNNSSAAKRASNDEAKRVAGSARETANSARQHYINFIVDADFFYSGAFYFGYLRSPIQTAETDADGKFVIEVPQTGSFVIAAQDKRRLGEETERYYWLQPVSLEGRQQRVQNLSNSNLTSATGTSSLILTKD
jgi:hypothetical protein